MANLHYVIMDISKRIDEKNISIVIDTSGSMYKNFKVIKESAIILLNSLFQCRKNEDFNIISFADQSTTFSKSMISFSDENLVLANLWINSLNCGSNTNTLSALVTAFNDYNVDAVVLFTDDLPNQKASVFHKCVNEISQGRPIHCIYVTNGYQDDAVILFWEKLIKDTDGSLHILESSLHTNSNSRQIFPYEIIYGNISDTNSLSSYSSSSSYFDNISTDCEEKHHGSETSGKSRISDKNLLGKVVLAKRRSNGHYYKGTIIKLLSPDLFVVLFQPTNEVESQLQQKCCVNEIIFYEEGKEDKIYSGDKVLVNLSPKKMKFLPGSVVNKEYLFDDDDLNGFDKVLKVKLFDGGSKTIPLKSAVRISPELFDRAVQSIQNRLKVPLKETHITNKQNHKHRRNEIQKNNIETESVDHGYVLKNTQQSERKDELKKSKQCHHEDSNSLSDSAIDSTKDYLRCKIEQQLKESHDLLSSLNVKDLASHPYKNELHDSGIVDNLEIDAYDRCKEINCLFKSLEDLYPPITQSYTRSNPTKHFKSGLIGEKYRRHIESPEGKFEEPSPPPTAWKTSSKRYDRSLQKRYHSASVGSNVVERSKKHWIGRPISKETVIKKHIGRYKSKDHPPTAEEYQTCDGVPFPVKADKKLYGRRPKNYVAGQRKSPEYKHEDIIAHRVVDFKRNTPPNGSTETSKQEIKEKIREKVLKTNREIRGIREGQACEGRRLQHIESNQQRKHEIHAPTTYTKVKITIEKDPSPMQSKLHKQEEQRLYEKERERANQQKKFKRIDALRERRNIYDKKETYSNKEAETNSQKLFVYEKNNLNRQIEDHESKLARLKRVRKQTDARLRHLKNSNDQHRDMSEHVKDIQRARVRCEILP